MVYVPRFKPVSPSAVGAAKLHAAMKLAWISLGLLAIPSVVMIIIFHNKCPKVPVWASREAQKSIEISECPIRWVVVEVLSGGFPFALFFCLMLSIMVIPQFCVGRFDDPKGVKIFLETGLPFLPHVIACVAIGMAFFTSWILALRSKVGKKLHELCYRSPYDYSLVELGMGWFMTVYAAVLLMALSLIGCYRLCSPLTLLAASPAIGVVLGFIQYRVLSSLVERVEKGWKPSHPRLYRSFWSMYAASMLAVILPMIPPVFLLPKHS